MKIQPAKSVCGEIELPGDKSISHRAAMLAAIANGTTTISNFLVAEDCLSTLDCLASLGIKTERDGMTVTVHGGNLKASLLPLDCGNSGTTARLLAGVVAGEAFRTVLTGDASLSRRPMKRIISPLEKMGAHIESDGGLPLTIEGGSLRSAEFRLEVASAQVKTCILFAGLRAAGTTTVIEPTPTRDHTERMLRYFGAEIHDQFTDAGRCISINGGQRLVARDISIPADVSSAAFFLVAAACLPNSRIKMRNVGVNPTRRGILDVLENLGVQVVVEDLRDVCNEPVADIEIIGGVVRSGAGPAVLDGPIIANIIDEIPIIAVLGTQLVGGIEIRGAAELRVKETDRITAIVENLRRMKAVVTEFDDGFRVERSRLAGAELESFGDHRIAMAFAVAGLLANAESTIEGSDAASVSFPGFFEMLAAVVR